MTALKFNELSPAQEEVLALLAEECAEVIQAIGKILRHGAHSTHPDSPYGPSNARMLEDELGDVRAARWLCQKYGIISEIREKEAADRKIRKVDKYLHHSDTSGCF